MATMTQRSTFEREIGVLRGASAGPTLILVAGIHGNEHGGVVAAKRVIDRIRADEAPLAGEVCALAGNVAGLRSGRRFAVKDLNRQWSAEKVEALLAQPPSADDTEDREQRVLIQHIDAAFARARGPVYFVDLHTTSAAGFPFALHGGTAAQHRFAKAVPLPVLNGLEASVNGVLSAYMSRRGAVSLAVEGGQHDDPSTIAHLEAVVWIAIAATGIAKPSVLGGHAAATTHLEAATASLPRVIDVLARYAITPEDDFVMEPGFANLARVSAGQRLARDRHGEIVAPTDGFVLLPLYQGQGDDGFFWGK